MSDLHQSTNVEHAPVIIADEVKSALSLAVAETGHGEIIQNRAFILEERHGAFARFQEEYVRSYISLADTKATWTFTIASAVLVYLICVDETKDVILAPAISWPYVTLLISLALLMASAFFSFRVVAPRLTSKSGEGIVFFGSVASRAFSDHAGS